MLQISNTLPTFWQWVYGDVKGSHKVGLSFV